MATIRELSLACTQALADADAHGAKVAAYFLRVQIHELFREVHHLANPVPDPSKVETEPLIRKSRDHA